MRRHRKTDRAANSRNFLDNRRIFDITHCRAAVFRREIGREKQNFGFAFAHSLIRLRGRLRQINLKAGIDQNLGDRIARLSETQQNAARLFGNFVVGGVCQIFVAGYFVPVVT